MSYARWSNSTWYAFYNVNGKLSLWYDIEHQIDIPYENAIKIKKEEIMQIYGCTEPEAEEAMGYVKQFIKDWIENSTLTATLVNQWNRLNNSSKIAKRSEMMTELTPEDLSNVITGGTSDGYHTFNELYEFRKVYNAALFNEWAANEKWNVHKSWRHYDGELCFGGGWFIVVAMLPDGQISNHYEAKDWDLFQIPETDKALFEFDGHSSSDVIFRLKKCPKPQKYDFISELTDEEIITAAKQYCSGIINEYISDFDKQDIILFARHIEKMTKENL